MPSPGFDKWRQCSGGMSTTDPLFSSQPTGPDIGLYIEYFDAVNGVAGQLWSPTGGVGSGQWNSTVEWDSMMNSSGTRQGFPMSKRPSPGEVSAFAIGGQPMGCMMYMGRATGSPIPQLFPAATPDPYGQIPAGQDHWWEPQEVSVVMDPFSDCNGCVYGAVDPGPPNTGWEEDDAGGHAMKKPLKPGGEKEALRDKDLNEEVKKMKKLIKFDSKPRLS